MIAIQMYMSAGNQEEFETVCSTFAGLLRRLYLPPSENCVKQSGGAFNLRSPYQTLIFQLS